MRKILWVMIEICALASGSNGNCYYVGNEHEAILVDMGISNRMLKKRMDSAGLSIKKVKAIFISHEHTDHVKGMRVVADMNGLKTYITQKTWSHSRNDYRHPSPIFFQAGETIHVGDIKVHTFRKKHDAVDPVSFRIEIANKNIAVLTDLGVICENIRAQLLQCDAAFLETNYDDQMLNSGPYPSYLKNRVASEHGHLSNSQALDAIVSMNAQNRLHSVLLSHISKDNNTIDKALEAFSDLNNKIAILATSRSEASPVVRL